MIVEAVIFTMLLGITLYTFQGKEFRALVSSFFTHE